ncbi:MAG: sulfatase [Gammaproteobacteria bacterium]|nr:sulfatase [Gammaproteobacteria bacterium]
MSSAQRKRCVIVMYDTLCRHFLPSYGNEWVRAPNFERLARRSVQFQNFYVGSMPCMPARREMHTGRYNFLHRSWGPLEPFDDSMPAILDHHGVHSHKVTDHHHYWEDGGATYHSRYTTFDLVRGQEGDKWIGDVKALRDPEFGAGRWPEQQGMRFQKQDNINRQHMGRAELQPQHKTFSLGLEFIERNKDADRWFVQIETFDPHEPFFSQKEFQDLYPHEYDGPPFDWPPYREVREDEQTVQHIRCMYAALMSFCDQQLGRVLDAFDRHDLWKDTMLIVNTDHGFLMGEHDWWAKVMTPFFQEIAHIPAWAYDPREPDCVGVRRDALVQTIDIAPTVLEYFDIPLPKDMQGQAIRQRMLDDTPAREGALYGVMGGQVNVTDGRYVYMRAHQTPDNTPLYEYTLMPAHMRTMFSPAELQDWERSDGFGFMKGCKVMKIPTRTWPGYLSLEDPVGRGKRATLLFDLIADPGQTNPIDDVAIEARMIELMLREMARNECPPEQYLRLGLPEPRRLAAGHGDETIEMPSDEAIRAACVLQSEAGQAARAHGANGFPKLPFGPVVWPGELPLSGPNFPANLRLRPGYAFGPRAAPLASAGTAEADEHGYE